jgi:hypothetical protein
MMTRRSLLAALPMAGAAIPSIVRAAGEMGFTSLFDGKTLTGWTVREGPESAFYVQDGAIVIHEGSNFPTWLRSEKQYENFDFRCEVFIKGWANSGIYFHAPEHGRNTHCGFKLNLFQKQDHTMLPESVGSIFPVVPPLKVNVKNQGEWNTVRIRMDWPKLQVWMNEEPVQDLNVESVPELRYRLRTGYIGIESLSYPLRFRNLRIQELPSKDKWDVLYEQPSDLEKWEVAEGKAKWETLGGVLRADNTGYLATKEKYLDFAFQAYIRGSRFHNGGIIFRAESAKSNEHYEIQLHDVEGAVYPTGSLYGYQRAKYPHIAPEQWYLFQLFVKGKNCVVRVDGENVVEYANLERTTNGPIMIQAHQNNRWVEYKHIQVKRI